MKKIFLIGSLVLSTASFGQHTGIGLTAGAGASWISNTGQKTSPATSLNIGFTFSYVAKSRLGFSADAVYSNEGVNYKDVLGVPSKTTFNSEYIRVPIRVTYYLKDYTSKIRPSVSLGPSFGILTGGKVFTTTDAGYVSRQYVKDEFKTLDLGLQACAGLSFKFGENMWLNTYLAYYQGLMKENKTGDAKMKNGNILVNASLTFNIKPTGSKY